jgi:hypothetical protein
MSMWLVIALVLGLVKLPIAALMLWLPFRDDAALAAPPPSEASDDDGGSRCEPAHPQPPPRGRPPQRGPRCGVASRAPARVRVAEHRPGRARVRG